MTKIATVVNGVYRNKEFTGTGELVREFTFWNGAERRLGLANVGYVKLRVGEALQAQYGLAKPFIKVTIGAKTDYTVEDVTNEVEQAQAKVDAERAAVEAAETAQERKNAKRRLARAEAALERATAV